MNMLDIHDSSPLSGRLRTAQEQLSGMFANCDFAALADETRYLLRGLELFLLGASQDAFDLECAARLRTARER